MQFFPGSGLFEAPAGAWINRRLDLPTDGRRWPVAYRADKYTEAGTEGTVDFASWQVVHGVEARARRKEQVHLFSAVTLPDGTKKLAVSRRRRSIGDPAELPDKTRDRYPMTTTRILDYREDPAFMRFARKSEKLREVLGGSPAPGAIELVRTSMDRPFQQPVLKQVGARSHNYYVLNSASGARMFIHFFQFWQPGAPRLVDRLGRLFMPHELGRYEVTDFRAIPRTATWDPTLDTGLAPGP
jgi:hypothetical protein